MPRRDVGRRASLRAVLMTLLLAVGACAAADSTAAVIPPELVAEARARGVVRAIVELRMPADVGDGTIELMKRRVLARIARTRHYLLRDLPGFPMLVLDASEGTLQELAHSPDVIRVTGETIDRPQR
jgi:hypothetical protein